MFIAKEKRRGIFKGFVVKGCVEKGKFIYRENYYYCMIKNITKKTTLAKEEKHCKSEWSKLRGLMFTRKLRKALIFSFKKEQLIWVHMFFVWYPIDILWLDKNKKVVQLKDKLRPFRIIPSRKPAKYIVELADGTIAKTKTSVGDKIGF
jgi:hypothetical protein